MTERIKAVQRMFWALLGVGVAVALLGVPVGDDGDTMAALEELRAFATAFDRATLERVLLSHASVQGVIGLDAVARAIGGRGTPKVTAAAAAKPITPRASIALSTLAQVHALTAANATIAIGSPKAEAVAQALSWRLSRTTGGDRYELQSIALSDAGCSQTDVQREQEVGRVREAAAHAREAAKSAEKQHAQAQDVYDLRRKWKATWKAISKANETRLTTEAAMQEAQKQATEAEQGYESLAKQAEGFEAGGSKKGAPGGAANGGECAVAVVSLTDKASGKALELRVPAAIERRSVSVPRITGADFPVTQSAGFWNELKDDTVAQAIERLRGRFSWHYRYLELGGVKLGGMTLLQFIPLALLPLFIGLIRRSRGVGATYNPFDRPDVESLPMVGVGASFVNLIVLVVLPLAGCVLCAWSLFQVDQMPIVPVLCALATIGLGLGSYFALNELLELRDAITRSHSNPPPAPSAAAR